MNSKSSRNGKGVLHKVRSVARRAVKGRVLNPPPSELRHTPDHPQLSELLKERDRLKQELQHQLVLTQDHPTSGNHMADDASEVFELTKDLAIQHHLETMLEQVEQAIHRLEEGTYGKCEKCGETIDPERLKVLPEATHCLKCAQTGPHGSLRFAPHSP